MSDVANTTMSSDPNSLLEVSLDSGFFSIIELGLMVILMLIMSITQIVSKCKKSKTTEEKLKILQETFDLQAIEKLGIVSTQPVSQQTTEALVKSIAKSVKTELVQSAVAQSTTVAAQEVVVPQEQLVANGSVKVSIKTAQGEIPLVLSLKQSATQVNAAQTSVKKSTTVPVPVSTVVEPETVVIEMPEEEKWKNCGDECLTNSQYVTEVYKCAINEMLTKSFLHIKIADE